MRKSTALALLGVVLLAVLMRLLPLTWALYWGADTGEYYSLTRAVAEAGRVPDSYAGWGHTYPQFPGLFFVAGGFAALGANPAVSLSFIPPILAALSAAGVFLIAIHLFKESAVGLLAAAMVAVLMPHVYATSHPMPASLADPLLVFALLALVKGGSDRRWYAVYVLLAVGLILTHHLTTYVLLIASAAHILIPVLVRHRTPLRDLAPEVASLGVVTFVTLAYWTLYASTFQARILPSVQVVPWWLLVGGFVAGLLAIPGIALLRRRLSVRYRPRWPSRGLALALFASSLGALLAILLFAVLVSIPGTTIPGSPWLFPLLLPVLALISLTPAGRTFCNFHRGGLAPIAWTVALIASVALGLVIANRVIVPYRHMQYLIVPVAIMSAMGGVRLVELGRSRAGRRAASSLIGLALAASIVSAYPPAELMAGFDEGADARALSAIQWSASRTHGLVLSDHLESSLLFGFGGVNATWDRAPDGLLAATFDEAEESLSDVASPTGHKRVDYALVTGRMESGAMITPWEPAVPMSPEALRKFDGVPFQRLYDDGYGRVFILHWSLS